MLKIFDFLIIERCKKNRVTGLPFFFDKSRKLDFYQIKLSLLSFGTNGFGMALYLKRTLF